MSDIVERLRDFGMSTDPRVVVSEAHEAADLITALRAEVERLVNGQHDVYAAAREEYRRKIEEQAAENAALREALEKISFMDKVHEHDLFSATRVAGAALAAQKEKPDG